MWSNEDSINRSQEDLVFNVKFGVRPEVFDYLA